MRPYSSISIIGLGRFGTTLIRLLKDDFDLIVYDADLAKLATYEDEKGFTVAKTPKDAYPEGIATKGQKHAVFYAVPISKFHEVVESHKEFVTDYHTLIDVLSVKEHPKEVLKDLLPSHPDFLLTHPMFGPDSSKDGFAGLPIVIDPEHSKSKTAIFWKEYFSSKGLEVIEMSSKEHDLLAAKSQGVTHFIGRLLEKYEYESTRIDTQGSKKLKEVMDMTCNDTWELFRDLQTTNQYTKVMRLQLGEAYDDIYQLLLPDSVTVGKVLVGIQGGIGSFNEQAATDYIQRNESEDQYQLEYLYTTENVLLALHKGDIDMGQFAIHNSVGGIVEESVRAMSKYKFNIVEEFAIKIAHYMMIRPDATFDDIDTIMTHPQVLKQCRSTLQKSYPELKLTSGEGELIDHANVAKSLSKGKINKNVAVMGPKVLEEIYGLTIVAEDLQDSDENFTSFLMVRR